MMPICGFRIFRFWRCGRVAEANIGEIATRAAGPAGRPWKQVHYLCEKHQIELLKLLGFK
jgi:hypothetical protein